METGPENCLIQIHFSTAEAQRRRFEAPGKRFASWTAVAETPLLRGQFIPDIYSAPLYNPPPDAIHP